MAFVGFRNAFFVGVAIPLSMMASFLVLGWIGYTLNMMVLFSLILMLGMLVDNAVVIVENIYRHREHGDAGPARRLRGHRRGGPPGHRLHHHHPLRVFTPADLAGDHRRLHVLPAGDAHHRPFGVAGGGADHQSDALRPSDETAAARGQEAQHGRTRVPPCLPSPARVVAPTRVRIRGPGPGSFGTGRSPRVFVLFLGIGMALALVGMFFQTSALLPAVAEFAGLGVLAFVVQGVCWFVWSLIPPSLRLVAVPHRSPLRVDLDDVRRPGRNGRDLYPDREGRGTFPGGRAPGRSPSMSRRPPAPASTLPMGWFGASRN